ncbi:hypothetical protein PV327_007137 [Microctonus hyperodae]|uniref:Uncharacterized protein n=1 Tax=Microctonus hyperodae TaxID=165561 RepID=A0AA39F5S2_MICHY|nr:hypothetical protein PV327_007137 [Microctonus hyperodae]
MQGLFRRASAVLLMHFASWLLKQQCGWLCELTLTESGAIRKVAEQQWQHTTPGFTKSAVTKKDENPQSLSEMKENMNRKLGSLVLVGLALFVDLSKD